MNFLRSRLADERGFALVVAVMILAITLGLGAAAASVAIDTSTNSRRDTSLKAAVEAADAGVRAAVFRLNADKPGDNACPTSPTFAAVGSTAPYLCPQDGPEALGNGATFSYWISRAMQPGDTCTGPTISNSTSDVAQRCITAVGTANGITARVQERVAAYTSTPVFPTAIFGTKSVTINNNVTITTDTPGSPGLLGTNGLLAIAPSGGGTTTIDGFAIPSSATVTKGGNVVDPGPESANAPVYPIPTPVNPGTSSQNTQSPFDTSTTYQGGTCNVTSTQVQTNCDYRITRGLAFSGCVVGHTPVTDCDPVQGNTSKIAWNPAGRTLYLGNNTSLQLGGGVYNFCSLFLDNGATISLAPNAKTSIFIDSPTDPNSGAPAGAPVGNPQNAPCSSASTSNGGNTIPAGSLTMNQGSSVNTGGTALNLQMYVYGDTKNKPPTSNVLLNNVSSNAFELYAPFSNITLNPSNNTLFRGAIVGYSVSIGNAAGFTYEADSSTLKTGSLEIYYRTFFEQCPGTGFTTTAPTTGC